MGQLGFFDAENRLPALSAKGDPLEAIDRLVPWESFRADIEAVALTPENHKKSGAGRKPIDAIVMFRMLVLQALRALQRGLHEVGRGLQAGTVKVKELRLRLGHRSLLLGGCAKRMSLPSYTPSFSSGLRRIYALANAAA